MVDSADSAHVAVLPELPLDGKFVRVFETAYPQFLFREIFSYVYTGHGGKSGTNDAPAEFVAWVRKILADADVVWQAGELGKADQGGGGTVAKFIAKHNIETVDLGA